MRRSITVDFVLPFVMNRHGIILEWVRGLFVGLGMGFAARHQSRCEVGLFFMSVFLVPSYVLIMHVYIGLFQF